MPLGRINLTIDDKLDEDFRAEVFKTLGFKRGNLQVAVEEAMRDWIDKSKSKKK